MGRRMRRAVQDRPFHCMIVETPPVPPSPATAVRHGTRDVGVPATPHASESNAGAAGHPRYTIDGSAALENHLHRTCEKIAAGLRGLLPEAKLEAVLLGGGYGRGEGGVLRTPLGDQPYNDLEFYVCLRGNRHLNEKLHGRALHVLGEILTPQAGIEVEFKITSLRELAAKPVNMFTYDLVSGHRWLIGHPGLLDDCLHHRDGGQIPLSEATRLLMNRCTGLLFAQERLQRPNFTPGDADFTRRNIAKAELALGDAVLVRYGQYHWSARERHRWLERIAHTEGTPWLHELCRLHARGVDFKFHPERSVSPRETLAAQHSDVKRLALQTWLWLETRRLRVPFNSPVHYVEHPARKSEVARLRNTLVNFKIFGASVARSADGLRHPRERVLHALVLLLWEPNAVINPVNRSRLQSELRTDATTFPALVAAYRGVWEHVN